jgi:hypothetical protein
MFPTVRKAGTCTAVAGWYSSSTSLAHTPVSITAYMMPLTSRRSLYDAQRTWICIPDSPEICASAQHAFETTSVSLDMVYRSDSVHELAADSARLPVCGTLAALTARRSYPVRKIRPCKHVSSAQRWQT